MRDADRFKLLLGPYETPRCLLGDKLFCEIHGWVPVRRFSEGRIPWPQTLAGRNEPLILCGDLLLAVRLDGVIVKPDVPLVPLDKTIINDSAGLTHPMVASTSTNFGAITAHYVAGYNRTSDLKLAFSPSALGMTRTAFVYNYFRKAGKIVQPQQTFSDTIANGIAYYIVMPIGPSGAAFLGDNGHYVSLGKKRITALTDNGTITASIAFAARESARIVFGYSPTAPAITATHGQVGTVNYTNSTGLFNVLVMPGIGATATIQIKAH